MSKLTNAEIEKIIIAEDNKLVNNSINKSVIDEIIDISCKMMQGFHICLLLHILKQVVQRDSKKGIYQIGNDCLTDSRYRPECQGINPFNVEPSIKCKLKADKVYKDTWYMNPKFPDYNFNVWKDCFYYMIHQQGLSGFREIYRGKDKKVSELSINRQNKIKGNSQEIKYDGKYHKMEFIYVNDFLNHCEKRLSNLISKYKEKYEKEIAECKENKKPKYDLPFNVPKNRDDFNELIKPKNKYLQQLEAGQQQYAFAEELKQYDGGNVPDYPSGWNKDIKKSGGVIKIDRQRVIYG